MKQMFDKFQKLVSEQDEVDGVNIYLIGKTLHGSICLELVMNKTSVFSSQKSTTFSFCNVSW